MDTLECIKARRSIRKYKDQPVEMDKIVQIIESGKLAPNAGNLGNFKFVLVKNDALRKQIAQAALQQSWMAQAPVHIVIMSEPEKSRRFYGVRGERFYTVQDCAAVAENMLLAATALGLGSCWVGAFNQEMVARILNMPESFFAHMIITLGYADEAPEMPPKYRIEYTTFMDTFGKKKNIPFSSMGWASTRVEKGVRDSMKGLKKTFQQIKDKLKKQQ